LRGITVSRIYSLPVAEVAAALEVVEVEEAEKRKRVSESRFSNHRNPFDTAFTEVDFTIP